MNDAILIAGPNGAGKTTFARQFLQVRNPSISFLNADEIQRENRAFGHPVAAGRELLRRLAEREQQGRAFAIETTLSSRLYAKKLEHWSRQGYRTILYFIELPSAEFAVRRVALRAESGGHSVPEEDVRRRFRRGLELFEIVYKPIVDIWYHWLSDEGGLRLVAEHQRI